MTATAPPVARHGSVRGILIGLAVAVAVVLVAVVVFAVTRPPERRDDFLDPASGSPTGARAVVAVLGDKGVDVRPATSLADVRRLGVDPATTTLLVYDAYLALGTPERRELLELADRVVVLDPIDAELEDFAPGVAVDGDGFGLDLEAACDLPAAQRAGSVAGAPYLYDIADAHPASIGCFESSDGSYAVVHTRTGSADVTIVGISGAFTNGSILAAGNAAFALNILGERETLVWYRPSLAELDSGGTADAADLTPPWVTPLVLLALGFGLAAAVWRGRRLGPLVAEALPVTVRANETMEGRARLYERAGAREHALDALRIGAVARIASSCGLPTRSTVDEVVDAVAALTGRERAAVAALLVDRIPHGDAALVELSDELLRLEADVTRIARGR